MEIKGDVQKDEVKDIQHHVKSVLLYGSETWKGSQRNLQKTAVLCQQMPEVHHGHSLARGHKERRTVEKS